MHFLFQLLIGLREDGLITDGLEAMPSWASYLVQPGLAARWRERPTTGQRQATLANEVLRWRNQERA